MAVVGGNIENDQGKIHMKLLTLMIIAVLPTVFAGLSLAEPETTIQPKERCPVCGMFVSKYRPWLAQLRYDDGKTYMFDGVKDMLAYYFEPDKYGGQEGTAEVYVTDYYTQRWIDGRQAYYVVGSDTLGPMGHEFIPLDSQKAAVSFKQDHKGKTVFRFEEISLDMVNRLRSGKSID